MKIKLIKLFYAIRESWWRCQEKYWQIKGDLKYYIPYYFKSIPFYIRKRKICIGCLGSKTACKYNNVYDCPYCDGKGYNDRQTWFGKY